MGRKIKPFAATHYVKKSDGEIVYIQDSVICWTYWNDMWYGWYRYDYSYGDPIKL